MSKEAMKLALEALEELTVTERTSVDIERGEKAITALREALAEQPAQQCRTDGRCQYAIDSGAEGMGHCPKGKCIMPAQQEPVAWMVDVDLANYQGQSEYRTILAWNAKPVWSGTHEINEVFNAVPLYTSPPAQRKPLTDEQLYQVFPAIATYTEANKTLYRSIARAIEVAHGIKGDA